MPPRRHTGLSRLLPYALDKRGRLALIALLAAVSAAAPVAGWHLVGDAIDNGVGDVTRQGRLTPRGAGAVTVTASYGDNKAMAVFTVVAGAE